MKTHLTILYGLSKASRKTYSVVNCKIQKPKTEFEYLFDSYTAQVNNIDDIYAIVDGLQHVDNAFIIRGLGKQEEMHSVQRTKDNDLKEGNFTEVPTAWVCFDFDKVEALGQEQNTLEALDWLIRNRLPSVFWNATYCYQFSSSAGLMYLGQPVKPGTNAHIFFYLDRALYDREFKAWFKDEIAAKTVDAAVFRTVQPIFVSTTVNKPDIIENTIENKVGIVRKEHDVVITPAQLTNVKAVKYEPRTLNLEFANFTLNLLNELGCIFRDGGLTLNLASPNEVSVGGWYLYKDNPETVYHNSHKPMRLERWLQVNYSLNVNMRAEYNLHLTTMKIKELEQQSKELLEE